MNLATGDAVVSVEARSGIFPGVQIGVNSSRGRGDSGLSSDSSVSQTREVGAGVEGPEN